jgi:hypothetical protein
LTVLVLVALALLGSRFHLQSADWIGWPATEYVDPAGQRFISRAQLRRIRAAIEVYQLERGPAPGRLGALVEAGLLREEDLHYPWRDGYYYRQTPGGGFILLPPLRYNTTRLNFFSKLRHPTYERHQPRRNLASCAPTTK